MQKNELLLKIESTMPFLSKTEQKLATYILKHPNEILSLSTKELALQSEVSEATLIRFTRKLDFSGYTEFKLNLSANIGTDETTPIPAHISKDDSSIDIYQHLATYTKASIDSTSQTLVEKDLDAAIQLIEHTYKKGNLIHLSGFGSSAVLVKELQIKLLRLGIPVIHHEDIHLQLESVLNMKANDLLICFSTFGNSLQTHQLIDIAKNRNSKVILITQYGNEKLAKKVDIPLFTSGTENQFRLASQTSIIVQSMIIDTIFLSLALKDLDQIQHDVAQTKKSFSDLGYYVK
ncbi:MAG: MurR/RpiR family transcriptional regulator [Anaerostipes sp.]|jgi:DNA-binding MurR/RpiR family transcriptional regulator|nr:MurR/RpiR family transcriptional regulator [Anaerostipes sp.]